MDSYFNTYGPRMSLADGRVISNFVLQALRNEPITIYGDGSQTRSFCYVDDMVDGLIRMMESDDLTGPINLGNPDERRILDIARQIVDLTASSSVIEFEQLPSDDPVRRRPDITLAQTLLGREPTIGFEEGLLRAVHYFESVSTQPAHQSA